MKKWDWSSIQAAYDEGKSWRLVIEQFGLHSHGIQAAVKAGLLTSRSRAQSISLALGGDGTAKLTTHCLECSVEYSFNKTSRSGKFCSVRCSTDYIWRTKHLASILNGTAGEGALRKYLRSQSNTCSRCGIGDWMGEALTLQVDHIDGDCDNNHLSNVRLLCPNCHSQTPNFGSKNRGKGIVTKRSMADKERRKTKHH